MADTLDTAVPPPDAGQAAAPALSEDDSITPAILKIAGVVVLGTIMSILDATVVNVALPTFQEEFGVEYVLDVAWTMTAYTLALATVIPRDRVGRGPVRHQAALHDGARPVHDRFGAVRHGRTSIGELIGFRVLQGLGGGMLMPLGMTIMTRAAGPHRIGRLMAILGVPMLLGPILGPILGGWLIDTATWHWIFLINLPLGIIAIVYAWRRCPRTRPSRRESFDFVGMLMLSPGLALFLYGVSSIPVQGTFAAAGSRARLIGPRWWSRSCSTRSARSTRCWTCGCSQPQPDRRHGDHVRVHRAFFGACLLVPSYFLQVRGET